MTTNPKYEATYQRPSYHSYNVVDITNLTSSHDVRINCPFAVKEIKISVGYTSLLEDLATIYATMPNLFPGSDVVMTFTDNLFVTALGYHFSSTLDKTISFTFREPQMITNSYALNVASVGNVDPVNINIKAIFHFECLG